MLMLTNEAWDMARYHQQDLMAEADGERLVALLPERRRASVRQGLARLCFRLASWLDAPAPRRAESCAEDWAAPIA